MIKTHTISIKNAFAGLVWCLKTQPNYRIHIILSLMSLIASWGLHVSNAEFLTVLILITIGFTVETVNTAIEAVTDAVDRNWREDIKIAKDVSAAAMLFFSIGAFIIAFKIFIPKLILLFFG